MSGRVVAVVQARMSSTRLPGKVLADVGGEPALALLLRRLGRARHVDEVVVATSDDPGDEPVAALAERVGVRAYRGPLDDVLGRFTGATEGHDGLVVRITADCPLIDPHLVDAVIELLRATPGCVYASNTAPPRTYPDGLDVEVMTADALRAIAAETTDPADREHVTPAIRRDPGRFPAAALYNDVDLGALRWTVDEPEDLAFVRAVVARLGDRRHDADMAAILAATPSPT